MKVLVTGASGFVGAHTVRALISAGHAVRGLSRKAPTSDRRSAEAEYVDGVDVGLSTSLTTEMFSDVDAIVHLVGIIQEGGDGQTFQRIHVYGTENVLDVAKRAGVQGRFIYMSALGSAADAPAEYSRTKFAAEQAVQNSGLPFTIFRPSLVIGPDGEFVAQMGDLVKHGGLPFAVPFPVIPVPGTGENKFQPIWIDDLTAAIVGALGNRATADKIYEVGGATQLSFNDLLLGFAGAMGVSKPLLHAPIPVLRVVATVMEALMPKPPVTRDQLLNLGRDNITDSHALTDVFGVQPLSFEQMLAKVYPK
jgi:uncharacterized protein YbjT (DUF2867 family)